MADIKDTQTYVNRIDELKKQIETTESIFTSEEYAQAARYGLPLPDPKELSQERETAKKKIEILRQYQLDEDRIQHAKQAAAEGYIVDQKQYQEAVAAHEANKPIVEALTSKELAPFIKSTGTGITFDITNAVYAGVDKKLLEKTGISPVSIIKAEKGIETYRDWQKSSAESRRILAEEKEQNNAFEVLRVLSENDIKPLAAYEASKVIDSDNIQYPGVTFDYVESQTSKQTSLVPTPEKYWQPYAGERELYEMKRWGKSYIPGWLTYEDWDYMTPLERGASIAGDVGATILIVLGTGSVVKGIINNRAAGSLKGSFPREAPGLRPVTNAELNDIIRGMKIPEYQKADLLRSTVPITEPVEMPVKVAIVNEGPTGAKFLQGTTKLVIPLEGGGITAGETRMPLLPVKGGTGGRMPSTATMTTDQLLKELGIENYSIAKPNVIPTIIPIPKRGEELEPLITPRPTPMPTPIPGPGITPAPSPYTAPTTTPAPTPTITPISAPTPISVPTPAGIVEPSPTPTPVITPSATPTPTPVPTPVPTPTPSPSPFPSPMPTPTPTPTMPKPQETGRPPMPGPVPPIRNRRETKPVIRKVTGAAGATATITYNRGIMNIKVKPPYREGTEDIEYTRISAKEDGVPKRTLNYMFGAPPKQIEIGMGVVKDVIRGGRTIQHIPLFRRND